MLQLQKCIPIQYLFLHTMRRTHGSQYLHGFTMIYSRADQQKLTSSGVVTLTDKKWKSRIKSYTRVSEGTLTVRSNCRNYLIVVGVYTLEQERKENTEKFYETLQEQIYK